MKKGFTLIELLAVIVILAIIALIATPIVLQIIEDSKSSATLRTAEYYLDGVELSASNEMMKNRIIKDGTYNILENGNICLEDFDSDKNECNDNDSNPDNNVLIVEVKGEKPSGGTITFYEGQITEILLNIANKEIEKNDKGQLVFKQDSEGTTPEIVLAPGLYDENDELIISWDELVTEYDFDDVIEHDYDPATEVDSRILASNIIKYYFNTAVKLVIGQEITHIGDQEFLSCTNLKEIVIPNSVTSIGTLAFGGCTGLTSIIIPDSVTSIGSAAFQGCTGLTSIKLPSSLTSVGDTAFYGCTGLTSITIPENVTNIANFAFDSCTNLINITILNSETIIDYLAFVNCTSLTTIYYKGNTTGAPWGAPETAVIETNF